jgi:hypothetical protein
VGRGRRCHAENRHFQDQQGTKNETAICEIARHRGIGAFGDLARGPFNVHGAGQNFVGCHSPVGVECLRRRRRRWWCGGGGISTAPVAPLAQTYTAKSGVAQKGPLIKGSTVTAQELDAGLSPTGVQYSYHTISDLGAFSPTSTFSSQYIGVNATGYYFDELANVVSTGTVTLNAYSDLAIDSVMNVNLLTTLE